MLSERLLDWPRAHVCALRLRGGSDVQVLPRVRHRAGGRAGDARAAEGRSPCCSAISPGRPRWASRSTPSALRALLARYFERMKAIVERHGGSVEKFIGDAVMAVFGVPVVHEDDALRAVRAAVEMRDALPELGLEGRIGVMTGEVVTGTEERLATGDAVNVAARLEQAAQPGEVLLGEPTLALVRDAVDVEPVEPLELKGKAEPVPAYRLVRVRDVPERRHEGPFVGRERELALLREAWQRVRAEQRCELVTVVGDAGIGKSRLVAEAARVGRCDGRARPLPPLRRGDHLLAGRRGAEAARPAACRRAGGGGDPLAARRERGGDVRRGDRLGVPEDARARRGGTAAGGRVRRHPVGRGDAPRPDRARRRCSPPARRSCCSAWRGPSSPSAAPRGR